MISVYSDGASGAGGGKPGGYGWVIVKDGQEPVLAWGYGGSPSTTNNLMELEGAIQGLEALISQGLHRQAGLVELVSDSQYILAMATGSWSVNKNHAQVERLQSLYKAAGCVRTRWVRGHKGETFNEHCDLLAGQGKEENTSPEALAAKAAKRKGKKASL